MTTRTSSELPPWYRGLSEAHVISGSLAEATSVTHDSRRVTPGGIFVAIPGMKVDGNSFIPDAVHAGSVTIIVELASHAAWQRYVHEDVTFVAVPSARIALAEAAAGLYDFPARTLGMIGVTGTDGKTTTTHLIAHILSFTGHRTGYLSSVEFGSGGVVEQNASHMTTLEASDIQRYLALIRDSGGGYAVVEASSIGLDLHRVDQCEFDVGVFTNLTPDHLDYHDNMSGYSDAKAQLFRMLGESHEKRFAKAAILNADDLSAEVMAAASAVPVVTYGVIAPAVIGASDIRSEGFGTAFTVQIRRDVARTRMPLLGDYNVSNALAAIAVAVSQGVDFSLAAAALESFSGVPGRMELIEEGQDFTVVVDIASTEPAMQNVLRILRPLTKGKLIVMFGAAGERDVGRRRGIARAVAAEADLAVVTNEDPRSEDAEAIIDEIAQGLKSSGWREGKRFVREPDRRIAIELAFERAGKNDTVLLAGKGTEQSIVIGSTHRPWDERRIARELLRERTGV